MPKAQKEVPATRQSTRSESQPELPSPFSWALPPQRSPKDSVNAGDNATPGESSPANMVLDINAQQAVKKPAKRGAKTKSSTARKNKKQPKHVQEHNKNMLLDGLCEETPTEPTSVSRSAASPPVQPQPIPDKRSAVSENLVNPMQRRPVQSPTLLINSTNVSVDHSSAHTVMHNANSPVVNHLSETVDSDTSRVGAQIERALLLPSGQFARGLIESLMGLKKQADRQQKQWEEPVDENAGLSQEENADSSPSSAVEYTRRSVADSTHKPLPTRRLIPQVIITKRPPAKVMSFQTAFMPASLLPREQDLELPLSGKGSLFTPANSDKEDEGMQSDGDTSIPQQVPEKPFNQFRVATEGELPPSDQTVPIQLGRPKLPWMDMSPYRITSTAARVVINGFEPFFSFYNQAIDTFLLLPTTHHVEGWPMYPGSHRALAREWNEIESALKDHECGPSPRVKKPRQGSPPSQPSPSVPDDDDDDDDNEPPFQDLETFSESGSDYLATQMDRKQQGREYSLSGSEDEDSVPHSPVEPRGARQLKETPTASTSAPKPDKGKGKATTSSLGLSTGPLLWSDEDRAAAQDAIEALMSIAVRYNTDFPTIFASIGADITSFFPPEKVEELGKRPKRPRHDNPFNFFQAYYRVLLENEGRKVPFSDFSAMASLAYAPYKEMSDAERAPHVKEWAAKVVDHAMATGGKKPALMKYHQGDPVKQLEKAIADVQAMGCQIRRYGGHIHFTAAVFSTDVVAQQGSVAMSSSPYFGAFVHQMGLRIRRELNQMIAFTQACEHGLITLDTPPKTDGGENGVTILDDDSDSDDEGKREVTSNDNIKVTSKSRQPLASVRPASRISTAAPHTTSTPNVGTRLVARALHNNDGEISQPSSGEFFGIAYQDLIDSVKVLDPLTFPQTRLAKHLHHPYRNTLEVLLVHGATLVWPFRFKNLIPGDPNFTVNKLSKEFLQDHYYSIKKGSPTVSFIAWPKEWRDIDPQDPKFNQLPLVQDEDGDVIRRVGNVAEWVNSIARERFAAQAGRTCGTVPIVDTRARVEAKSVCCSG
ncbi:hypothetical protein BKA70DRAFT_1239215 [Coprinopsis sp. MPI-PUGE-AT-0042]|nr:hypothetical protein BKA70DRAFT_1239215 [Coprinopsis sp. MPI-PUGE-AT-0042]